MTLLTRIDSTGPELTLLTRIDSTGLELTPLDSTGFHWTRIDSTGFHWTRIDSTGPELTPKVQKMVRKVPKMVKSGPTAGNAAPGPVPRWCTKVRTVPTIPTTPGTPLCTTVADYPYTRVHTLSQRPATVHQASFRYDPLAKIPLCLKPPFLFSQKTRVSKTSFLAKKLTKSS